MYNDFMDIIYSSFEVCMPLLFLVAIGVVLKRKKLISQETARQMSTIVLKLFLPINIFMNIYNGDLKKDLSFRYLFVLLLIYAVTVIINLIIVNIIIKDRKSKSAMLQNAIRANQTLFALPLAINIAGDAVSPIAALSSCIITPINNLYALSEFEYYEGNTSKLKILINVLKSPMTIATIIAFVFKIVEINIPTIIYTTFNYISRATVALSLIMVGSTFNFAINKDKIQKIIYIIGFKTLLCPFIAVVMALMFRLNQIQLVTIMCLFASPVASASYATAAAYDTDMDLINGSLVYSYVFGIISLPLVISIMRFLALI